MMRKRIKATAILLVFSMVFSGCMIRSSDKEALREILDQIHEEYDESASIPWLDLETKPADHATEETTIETTEAPTDETADAPADETSDVPVNETVSVPPNPEVNNLYENVKFSDYFNMTHGGIEEENPEMRMAHNIYSDPDLSGTSGRYSGFLIDFKGDYTGLCTYWALCNWDMDLSSLRNQYRNVSGGGAYCGLQNTWDGKMAIMSFWDIYCDGETIRPSLVRPVKDGNGSFDNEGSGANYITSYKWKMEKWYRMYLNCYDDAQSGHTYVEMWVMDIATGKWTEICCYDTHLIGSCLVGGMSQFMENYWFDYSNELRSFQYANLYVREYDTGEWVPITQSRMSIDTCWDNKKGTYAFGSTSTNLWGITCGFGPDSAELNADISSMEQITPTVGVGDLPR